jgi:crotonobetainyl-CoA:carnitine CoA-transferase CaiB-like acyl-CoA transferase
MCLPPAPLEGIRVLDLSSVVAGPFSTMILADLGADVIKVERIDGGDDARSMGPHRGTWGAYFVPLNRGKRSIALDITQPRGHAAILRLAATCDVFVENFRGGKAAELGVDETAIRGARPNIIYASLSAFGSGGPDYRKPGYDALIQGRSGIMSVTGADAHSPTRAGVSIVDMGAGMWLAMGVLAALLERQRTGRGQRVDASLLETGVMLMAYHLLYREFSGENPVPQGSGHTAFAPYGAFSTADGWMMIGVSNDRVFQRLCSAVGQSHWTHDPLFRTNVLRVENRIRLNTALESILEQHPTAHWTAVFDQQDVPASAIQNAGQVLEDTQVTALGILQKITLPGGGEATIPRVPVHLSATPPAIAGPPPELNEHAREILAEAGFTHPEIEALLS